MKLLASRLGGVVAIALGQRPDGLGLSDISRAVEATPSSVQRALEGLLEADIVTRREGARPVFFLRDGPVTDPYLALVNAVTPPERLMGTIARANPGVEFVSIDDDGILLVTAWNASTDDLLRLEQATRRATVPVAKLEHDELRRSLPDEPKLRDRAAKAKILKGTIARSFPDRTRHGDAGAPGLGSLNPLIKKPSQRSIAQLARRFGLRRMSVFGSAVRADLRPDSDVDVLIEPGPDVRLSLSDRMTLRSWLEDLFGRDVDVVNARFVRPELLGRVEQEAVVLYGDA